MAFITATMSIKALTESWTPTVKADTSGLILEKHKVQLLISRHFALLVSMNITSLMVLLGLLKPVCNSPVCPEDCVLTTRHHQQHFRHLPDLQNISVAPWELKPDAEEDREPQFIQNAACNHCTVKDMVAKSINISISVYKRVGSGTCTHWCKCPYQLAVGCTCVNRTTKMTT